jgi:regulator of protease activity HflC (stomatin/prohibitin superfamily)
VEITAQEMLTKDRVALRVTLTAFRRIDDPEDRGSIPSNNASTSTA